MSHGPLVEKPGLCNRLIVDLLATDPVPKMAPIRRANVGRGRTELISTGSG